MLEPSDAPAEPENLPHRILLATRRKPILDELGFVRPIAADRVFRVADLLDQSAALVVAPPWTGKTFIAHQLYSALKASSRFGNFHHLVSFERPGRAIPPWWDLWKEGDKPACWIVDAVDEDERLGDGRQWQEILERIADLRPEEQARLHVLFFCRENEVPSRFEQSLAEIYGVNLRQLRLAGLDRESARELVGADCFERVCRQIEAGSLKEVSALPVVLEHLKRNVAEPVSQAGVWRGVLMDLLRDRKGRPRLSATATEVEDRFEVVQWLAAVLTFSGTTELSLDASGPGSPSLEELVPRSTPSYGSLREAAREAIRTAVFERSEENRFRFSQDHVRQWFAAFALKDKGLLRIRPLLTDEAGHPNQLHKGVMDILARITDQPEVRDWINRAHGSVLSPSGSGPWTLADVVRALDALQDLARVAPWGLPLWREERLAELAVTGVGAEIARRLEERLSTEEQELLLDIALAVGVSEPLSIAVRIVQDRARDRRVRALAAELVARFGEKGRLEPLERWAHSLGSADEGAADVLPILAVSFLKKGFWDFEAAANFALSGLTPGNEWLQYSLAEEMTIDAARRIVTRALAQALLFRKPLVRKALEKIIGQDAPTEADYDLLLPLALKQEAMRKYRRYGLPNLVHIFEKDEAARRKLFLAGLQQDPDRKRIGSWHWRDVLRGGDTDWLLEVIEARRGSPTWLWEMVYVLFYRRDASRVAVRRGRAAIRAHDAELLRRLDKEKRLWKRQEERSRQQRERQGQIYEILPLVRETLDDQDLELHLKMLRLSWCCFTRSSARPATIRGSWEDLAEEARREVFLACRMALVECDPTPIPTGQSYPTRIEWEAACFARLLEEDREMSLSPELIQKWLPAVLQTLEGEWKPLLQKSIEVDRISVEDLIVQAILREIESHSSPSSLAQDLTPEIWSERLASALESAVVENSGTQMAARIDLLVRIGRVYPDRASVIARRWADDSLESSREIREKGTDILLAVDPPEGWRRLKELMRSEEPPAVLVRMTALLPHYAGPKAVFEIWTAELLGQLASCLHETYPGQGPEKLPGRVYSHEREDDLRELRDAIPKLLLRRNRDRDGEVLEQLARQYDEVRLWLGQTLAQDGMDSVLSGTGFLRGEIPVDRVVRLLMDVRYRLIRTADDLLDLVLEELRSIAGDVKHHLAMLYRPREGGRRQRLPEEALQAYLHCRLMDRMTSGYLDPQPQVVFLNREPLAAKNKRNDLKIQASSFDGKPLTLIIEIKWSDNPDVSTSLSGQLGAGYLLESGCTHGIYLVGWCGESKPWKDASVPAPEPRSSLGAWQDSLAAQAALFQEKHPGLRIEPALMDLAWGSASTVLKEPAGPAQAPPL